MTFATFQAARDAFYCAALLSGLTIGFLLRFLLKAGGQLSGRRLSVRGASRSRGAFFTAILYMASISTLAGALVLLFSRGAVLYDDGLLAAALCLAVFTVICVLFPIHAAFPAFLVLSLLTVWSAAVFLRYPKSPASGAQVQVAVRAGDLLPVIGGSIRYLDKEPHGVFLFRAQDIVISPSKNRLVFSFVLENDIIPSL